jgi:hypothetical protein
MARTYKWMSAEERQAAFDSMQRDLVRRYGGLGRWLSYRVAGMYRRVNDPCVDNFRVCEMGRDAEETAYVAARERGCCGAYDDTVTHHRSGRTFMFGCNYGH